MLGETTTSWSGSAEQSQVEQPAGCKKALACVNWFGRLNLIWLSPKYDAYKLDLHLSTLLKWPALALLPPPPPPQP